MGTIPSWFGSLSKLQTFDLYGNQFSGSLPSTIFNLSALRVIDLSYNQLSGIIPREIGNSTMLKEIYLGHNNFEEIPNEIGTLEKVEKLVVEFNSLKGYLPMFVFNMSSMTTLGLDGNSFYGSAPDNICQHLPSIQELSMGDNQFEGPLPSKLWQCKGLIKLVLEKNNFSGSIPKNLGNLTNLMQIYLNYNNLTGSIPDEIGDLQSLQTLALHENNLNGFIPSKLFNMPMITAISLTDNQLSGSLPADIARGVPNLQGLYLAGNELSGVIPNFLSNGSKLRILDLAENSFSGFIPSTICSLTNLELLNLHRNSFMIDTSSPELNFLSCLPNLRLTFLNLAFNPLNTTLPISFGNLSTSLEYLYLRHCNLRGNIPNDIGNFSSLTTLGMGYNQLNGSIPKTVGRLQNLEGLYLNDNKLEGNIPFELCQLHKLPELRLDGNQLSGSIPSCFGNLTENLRMLSLGYNLLNSKIPSTLWGFRYILDLNLSSNFLIGSIQDDIGNLKSVRVLDLSNNHLSGVIPANIGDLKDLVTLSLANNDLEGLILSSFGTLLSLEVLDLSKNNFSGVIPKSLEELSYLNFLNLSFNRLQGEVPTGGPFRNFSAQSFLSNAQLCGEYRLLLQPCKNRTDQNSKKSSKFVLKYTIGGVISALILLLASMWILIICWKRKVDVATETTSQLQQRWRRVSQLELMRATNGFDESNLLGIGGFGSVYRGTLSDGIDVAVKVFNLHLEGAFKSFDRESEMLSNIRHRNLIKLISCCSQIDFKAVVLQYMPNGSLDNWLYSQNYFCLNILQRLNIMSDVAMALEYLHHDYSIPIVHCDLKPSNILLDDEMVGHVADFGLARLLGGEDFMSQTMTLATVGYMAPEFGREGIVSTKGDVYSFGIVMMETFTKRKPTDEMFGGEMTLKQWITNSISPECLIVEVVDANLLLGSESMRDCLTSIMKLALNCCAESPQERISIRDVVVALNKIKIKFLKDCEGEPS